jgi:hypothetical protein
VSEHAPIVEAAELRARSGLTNPSAIRRWASRQGFRVFDGGDGPWTTLDALNAALGVGSANDDTYKPDQVL